MWTKFYGERNISCIDQCFRFFPTPHVQYSRSVKHTYCSTATVSFGLEDIHAVHLIVISEADSYTSMGFSYSSRLANRTEGRFRRIFERSTSPS